jgi:Trk K+ transport system NAD-binding subunit
MGKSLVKLGLFLRKIRLPLILIIIWFGGGFLFHWILFPNEPITDVILATFFMKDFGEDNTFEVFYQVFGTIIISQGIFAVIIERSADRINPKLTAEKIAKKMHGHVVIIGWSHLALRIIDYLNEKRIKYVMIEENEELVEDLVESGDVIIIRNPLLPETLELANVKECKEVFLVNNNIKQAIILVKRIREINENCPIHCRIFDERLKKLIKGFGVNIFSSTKWTFEKIRSWFVNKPGLAIIVGWNNFSRRLVNYFESIQREYLVIEFEREELDTEEIEDFLGAKLITGSPTSKKILTQARIYDCTQFIITLKEEVNEILEIVQNVKELTPRPEIISRAYDDEVAEILEVLDVKTFSTSYFAFENLKKELID